MVNKSREYTMQELDKMTSTFNSVIRSSSSKPKKRGQSENNQLSTKSKRRKTSQNSKRNGPDNSSKIRSTTARVIGRDDSRGSNS